VKNEMLIPIKKETEMKIIGVLKERGETRNFSKERVERMIKNLLGLDFKLKIVPLNTVTHEDCEPSISEFDKKVESERKAREVKEAREEDAYEKLCDNMARRNS
jgi:hypothetical protein